MESKLQALKVVDLKKLLQDALLPVSGTKADLIKRLLENPEAAASVGAVEAEDEEDLIGDLNEDTNAAPAQPVVAPASASVSSATVASAGVGGAGNSHAPSSETSAVSLQSGLPADAADGKDAETRKAEVVAELEKRKARAQKFGTSTEEIDAKLKRIERFGLEDGGEVSLQALDGELRPQKGRKEARAEKRANGGAAAAVPALSKTGEQQQQEKAQQKITASVAPLDPVEEEKKRKRAERFGAAAPTEPTESKKSKT